MVAAALQLRVVRHGDGHRAIGIRHPSATWRTISPATHEQAMLMQALMLSSCEGGRDRQGVGARVRAAHRCFDRMPADSIAPSLAVGLEQKVELCLSQGLLLASTMMECTVDVMPSLFVRFSGSTNRRLRAR